MRPPEACPSATLALTSTWSEGLALLNYVGHASVHCWAHEPLLLNTDLKSLTGTVGLPFVLSLDCLDAYWMLPPKYGSIPDTRSIGEWATTVLTDRGAIAAFGPAGLGSVAEEKLLAQGVYRAMFQNSYTLLRSLWRRCGFGPPAALWLSWALWERPPSMSRSPSPWPSTRP